MNLNRSPVREIRNEFVDASDRIAAFHEHRVDTENFVRDDNEEDQLPFVVVHLAPEGAFSESSLQFPAPEMLDRDVGLVSYDSDLGNYGEVMANGIETHQTPRYDHMDGEEHLVLFENMVLEIATTRITHEQSNERVFNKNGFTQQVEKNLATIFGLLAASSEDNTVHATATYIDFEGVGIKNKLGARGISDDYIQTSVVSFDGPFKPKVNYEGHIEQVDTLLRPLWQSAGFQSFDVDHLDSLEIPNLKLDD